MLNWVTATSRPRNRAGEISAMYIGETTDAARRPVRPGTGRRGTSTSPTPGRCRAPRRSRARRSRSSVALRPNRSAGGPPRIEPTIVPIRAMATVKPRAKFSRPKRRLEGLGRARDHGRVEAEQAARRGRRRRCSEGAPRKRLSLAVVRHELPVPAWMYPGQSCPGNSWESLVRTSHGTEALRNSRGSAMIV